MSTTHVSATLTTRSSGPNASLRAAAAAAHPTSATVHVVSFANVAAASEEPRPTDDEPTHTAPSDPFKLLPTSRTNGAASVATAPPTSAIMSTKTRARDDSSSTSPLAAAAVAPSAGLGVEDASSRGGTTVT